VGEAMTNPAYGRLSYRRNRKAMLAMSDGRCSIAGCKRPALTADHITPLSQGGSNDLANLRPMCAHHNSQLSMQMLNRAKAERKVGRRSRKW
jgi:5-methylcytosine-specific restriction endonuclease McrA